jgi:hypothetical protein
MQLINGYQYLSEQEAITAQTQCNTFYGIPKSSEDITENWIGYNFAELNTPQFWYITFDESLLVVLGTPSEFEVIQPPFPNDNKLQ